MNRDSIDLFVKYQKEIFFVLIEYVNEIYMMMVHKNMRNLNEYYTEKVLIDMKYYYNNNVQK